MLGYILDVDDEEAREKEGSDRENHINEDDRLGDKEDIEVEINNLFNFDHFLGEEDGAIENHVEELIESERDYEIFQN